MKGPEGGPAGCWYFWRSTEDSRDARRTSLIGCEHRTTSTESNHRGGGMSESVIDTTVPSFERFKWPKIVPPLSERQKIVADDFMKHWHKELPRREFQSSLPAEAHASIGPLRNPGGWGRHWWSLAI